MARPASGWSQCLEGVNFCVPRNLAFPPKEISVTSPQATVCSVVRCSEGPAPPVQHCLVTGSPLEEVDKMLRKVAWHKTWLVQDFPTPSFTVLSVFWLLYRLIWSSLLEPFHWRTTYWSSWFTLSGICSCVSVREKERERLRTEPRGLCMHSTTEVVYILQAELQRCFM